MLEETASLARRKGEKVHWQSVDVGSLLKALPEAATRDILSHPKREQLVLLVDG